MKHSDHKKILPWAVLVALEGLLVLTKYRQLQGAELLLEAVLLLFGCLAAWGDLREQRIPNQLLAAMLGAWVLIIVPQLLYHTEETILLMLDGLAGFLSGGLVFLVVYLVSRKGLGGGDVKLMAVSGLYLGFERTLVTMLYGSVLAALVGCVLIVARRIGKKDPIPLAPFLLVGMVLAMLLA